MSELDKIHDKMFKNTLTVLENLKLFLKLALPDEIKKRIDLTNLEIDPTGYVSDRFKESFSDIAAHTTMRTGKDKSIDTDIYFLLEHKSRGENSLFVQVMKYMQVRWEKDIEAGRPPRVIIPIVFYHGKEDWTIPHSFIEQFDVDDEVKQFMLNFRYILFDTRFLDFQHEDNWELRDNVFLFTALALLKNAFNDDMGGVREIFKFWHEKGFIRDQDKALFFLAYIYETKDISPDELKKILEESKIEGGDIMPTLAQRLRDEGRDEGIRVGRKEGRREGRYEGAKAEKRENARQMLLDNLPVEQVKKYTGLTDEEIKSLMH